MEARLYGLLRMAWLEYPFEWVRDRSYQVQRDFLKGPLLRFVGGGEVPPEGRGARLRGFAEIPPRHFVLAQELAEDPRIRPLLEREKVAVQEAWPGR